MKTLILVVHPHLNESLINKRWVEELTRPFELTFEYVKADYRPPFVFYGIELNSSEEWIEQSVPRYMKFLEEFSR